jgi:DNA polymerase V
LYNNQVNQMSHGGKRSGAGRKSIKSPFGEPTYLVRMPISVKPKVVTFLEEFKRLRKLTLTQPHELIQAAINPPLLELPIYLGKVSAGRTTGFASPAQDYEQERLDLNKKLVTNATATFFYTVGKSDDSMIDAGIMPEAILVVDRSITAKSGKTVIAIYDGEYVVKRLYKRNEIIELRSMNKTMNYPPIRYREGLELIIEGVVTYALNPQ